MSIALAAFLAARLDEDEEIARRAAREGGTWEQEDPERFPGTIMSLGGHVTYDEGAPDENQGPHIARHDPARVLREVAADRVILGEHQEAESGGYCELCYYGYGGGNWPCPTVRALLTVYSDHPDYDPKWAW